MQLPQIPLDKVLHFGGGAVTSFAVGYATGDLYHGQIAAMAAGELKEVYDARHPNRHTADPYDAIATSLGGVAGCGLRYLLGML